MGAGVTLLGSQPVPAHSFGIVLENALALVVHDTEVVLGIWRNPAVPAHSFGIVLENALALAYMTPRLYWALA